ncbi:unnamed protein product, partial [Polarella glacialis]
ALAVAYGPRLMQGLAASAADFAVYRVASSLLGARAAAWALAVQLGSWFHFYCLPRTYSSSAEAVLGALALELWLRRPHGALVGSSHRPAALLLGSLCVALRPTAAVYWAAMVLYEVQSTLLSSSGKLSGRVLRLVCDLLAPGLLISVVVLAASTLLDSIYYGAWVLVTWNFARFNLLHDGGALYGSHPWHWYATEGLAVTLGTFLPFFLAGAWLCCRGVGGLERLRGALVASATSLAVLSLASHKEYRFLLPFLPLASLLAGVGLERAEAACARRSKGGEGRRALVLIVFGPQLVAALFFSLVHQRGPEAVMAHLRLQPPGPEGAFFLTPCHATPLHAFLHQNVPLHFLDCSPGHGSLRDRFFERPLPMLAELFPSAEHPPSSGEAPPEGSPVEPCLQSRYKVQGMALPEVAVVWGSLISREEAVGAWLEANGFELEALLEDGVWTEGPYVLETWPTFRIYRRKAHLTE